MYVYIIIYYYILDIVLAWFHTVRVSYIEDAGIIQFSRDSIKITGDITSTVYHITDVVQ